MALHQQSNLGKRRITLTVPNNILNQAERIAKVRNVDLGTVLTEAFSEGLQIRAAEPSDEGLAAYRKAFEDLSDEEVMLLDGIVMEARQSRR